MGSAPQSPIRPSPVTSETRPHKGRSPVTPYYRALTEPRLKRLVKQAVAELLEERPDVLRELVGEAIEDIPLVRAIKEGEATPAVPRDEVLHLLEDAP